LNTPIIREIQAKSILSKSGISGMDYCLNPYVGCAHGCRYCYATFMKRYTGHSEEWGSFVDIKVNAPEVLAKQVKRIRSGQVLLSSVTDPYQPMESQYGLTRQCLEILLRHSFPVDILTKSPLVLRDIDRIKEFEQIEVGLTITTDDDEVRKIFEPNVPSIAARLDTLKRLFDQGVRTYVFIGPILPMNPERLAKQIRPYAHRILIDRMNYVSKTRKIFTQMGFTQWLEDAFADDIMMRLRSVLAGKDICLC
jgi:DNA repair photolyase